MSRDRIGRAYGALHRPYYRSTYVFVYKPSEVYLRRPESQNARNPSSLLETIEFAARACGARNFGNVRGYTVYGDYRSDRVAPALGILIQEAPRLAKSADLQMTRVGDLRAGP